MRNHLTFRSVVCMLLSMLLLFSATVSAEEIPEFVPPDDMPESTLSEEVPDFVPPGEASGTVSAMSVSDRSAYGIPADEVSVNDIITKTRELIDTLPYDISPNIKDIRVVGYASYNDLPGYWGPVQDALKIFSGNLIDAFSNLDEKKQYFLTMLAMCATDQPIDWVSESELVKYFGDSGKNATYGQIIEGLKNVADATQMKKISGVLKGIEWINSKGVKSFCDTANQLILLNSVDWERADALANAWNNYGNQEMKDVAGVIRKLKNSREDDRVPYLALSIITEAGLDSLVGKIVGKALEKASKSGAMLYNACIFAIDTLTSFTALSGSFKDMECAARSLEACQAELKYALISYNEGLENALASKDSSRLTPLFRRLVFTGINYAQACAIMDGTYADYVKVGSGSMLGIFYITDRTEKLAVDAEKEKKDFNDKSEQLQNLLKQYEKRVVVGEKRQKAVEQWTHHWRMKGHPNNTIDISCTWDGIPTLTIHFAGETDFTFLFDPYEDQNYMVSYFGDVDNGLNGTLMLGRPEDGQMEAYFRYSGGSLDKNSRLYPYMMEYGNGVEPSVYVIADNPDEGWVHHWKMEDHPENTMDIVETPEGEKTVILNFEKAGGYIYDLDLDNFSDMEEVAGFGEYGESVLRGYMWLDLDTGNRMKVMILYQRDDLTPDDPLYPYIARGQTDFVYYVVADDDLLPDDDTVVLDEAESRRIFETVSSKTLLASSGAGAWEGLLNVNADGSFAGYYYDSDMGIETTYECSFSGRFSPCVEVHGNTYWIWVEELNTREVPGTSAAGGYGDRIEYTDPPVSGREYLVLTLPGTPTEDIPETVRGLIIGTTAEWDMTDFSDYMTLTLLEDGWGFFADSSMGRQDLPSPLPVAEPSETAPEIGSGISDLFGTHVSGDWRYELLTDGTAGITGYLGTETEVYVPSELDGYPVTRIGYRAFYGLKNIERVWMNDVPVTRIGAEAFRGCEKLCFIQLPQTLKEIGARAFDYCIGLTDIVLPDQTEIIGWQAFSFCSKMEEVYCPESLLYIDSEAFIYCPNAWFYVYPNSRAERYCCIHNRNYTGPGVRSKDTVLQEIRDAIDTAERNRDYTDVWVNQWVSRTRPDLILDIFRTGYGIMHAKLTVSGEPVLSFSCRANVSDNTIYDTETDPSIIYGSFVSLYLEPTEGYPLYLWMDEEALESLSAGWGVTTDDLVFTADSMPDPQIYGFDRYWYPSEWDGRWHAEKDGHTADLYIDTDDSETGYTVRFVMDERTVFDNISITSVDPYMMTAEISGSDRVLWLNVDSILLELAEPVSGSPDPTVSVEFQYMGPCVMQDTESPEIGSGISDFFDNAAGSYQWTGYWMTNETWPSEFVITDNGNGTLHMKAVFIRYWELDAELSPSGKDATRFTVGDGEYTGVITRLGDGMLHLVFDGGTMLEEEESEIQYYFLNNEFDLYRADAADLWYDESGRLPEKADWIGTWEMIEGDHESTLDITDNGAGGLNVVITLDNFLTVSAETEMYDDMLDFYTDEFSCILTLNMKHRRIMAFDFGSSFSEVYDWLDETGYMPEYTK